MIVGSWMSDPDKDIFVGEEGGEGGREGGRGGTQPRSRRNSNCATDNSLVYQRAEGRRERLEIEGRLRGGQDEAAEEEQEGDRTPHWLREGSMAMQEMLR